jgi:hypothetical protein
MCDAFLEGVAVVGPDLVIQDQETLLLRLDRLNDGDHIVPSCARMPSVDRIQKLIKRRISLGVQGHPETFRVVP